jgi:hypothetical protein
MLCRSGQIFGQFSFFHNSDTVNYRKGINYAKCDEIIEMLHVSYKNWCVLCLIKETTIYLAWYF